MTVKNLKEKLIENKKEVLEKIERISNNVNKVEEIFYRGQATILNKVISDLQKINN